MKKGTLFGLFLMLIARLSYADTNYLVFINSDVQQQQEQAELLNYLLLEQKILLAGKVYLIDSASQQKEFRGEIQYLYDGEGRYVAKYLPTQLPEVIRVDSGRVKQHVPLSDFLAAYLPSPVKEFP
ncbi:hypothetical protein [Vibrio cincinnatiensis]|uniref:hypothetical protein n=1 Tax=Vibrio cincinnatiensis TaxID=675 RepID=UPI001EDF54AE|nr:hypothetical protein [Vibrio cincinnatiensis]MCG3722545.1 hypothetical protein [Vibrio cincinnatiensis]